MKYYFAPLEGITGYVYRNAFQEFYPGVDKYFSPFIENLKTREIRDIMPEYNKVEYLVPQVLTNDAERFLAIAAKAEEYGYKEINLNLGCPSMTVVTKCKGAGFLADINRLTEFLDKITEELNMRLSIKTRIGKEDREEFYKLIEIFNRYDLEELIIHPRLQKDFYRGTPDVKMYGEAVKLSRNPLCYNGDLCSVENVARFREQFPDTDAVMIGRGFLANPGLITELIAGSPAGADTFWKFHDRLLEGYIEIMSGDRNVLFKMKELWTYMIKQFPGNEKTYKKIMKSSSVIEYKSEVAQLR